jgi:hypothetical protein
MVLPVCGRHRRMQGIIVPIAIVRNSEFCDLGSYSHTCSDTSLNNGFQYVTSYLRDL